MKPMNRASVFSFVMPGSECIIVDLYSASVGEQLQHPRYK
jgi:hypothetical protein